MNISTWMKKHTHSLQGMTVAISGATGGLGKAFAEIYAKANNNLFLVSTSEERLADMKLNLESRYGITVDYLTANLSIQNQCEKVYTVVKEKGYFTEEFNKDDILTRREVYVTAVDILEKYIGRELGA